jgi:hypothetical protein
MGVSARPSRPACQRLPAGTRGEGFGEPAAPTKACFHSGVGDAVRRRRAGAPPMPVRPPRLPIHGCFRSPTGRLAWRTSTARFPFAGTEATCSRPPAATPGRCMRSYGGRRKSPLVSQNERLRATMIAASTAACRARIRLSGTPEGSPSSGRAGGGTAKQQRPAFPRIAQETRVGDDTSAPGGTPACPTRP